MSRSVKRKITSKGQSKAEMEKLVNANGGLPSAGKKAGGATKVIGRKALRKNLRQLKKLKRQAHSLRKQGKRQLPSNTNEVPPETKEEKFKTIHQAKKESTELNSKKGKQKSPSKSLQTVNKTVAQKNDTLQREQKLQRVKQLKIANDLEDKNIRKIAKQLKMHKRKSKSIPKSFLEDGLDYLLDVCDPEKRSKLAHEEFDFADNDAGFEEDLAFFTNKDVESKAKKEKTRTSKPEIRKLEDLDESVSGESDMSAENSADEDDLSDEDMSMIGEDHVSSDNESDADNSVGDPQNDDAASGESEIPFSDEEDETHDVDHGDEKTAYREDIYGRLRDEKGNVVTEPVGKYVPPGKRLQDSAGNSNADLDKLKRQMKGLFNRLAETNLPSIVSTIEQLYLTNTRHNMQQAINTLIIDSLVGRVLSPDRLIMEHCLLVAALHANVGTEVGAQFLEVIVRRFDSLFQTGSSSDEDKVMDNLMLILSHLYNFGVVGAPLLTDVLNKLAERFSEKDIELILIVLRSVGFALRKEDPVGLKQVILSLQTKAGQTTDQPIRVRFMLDVLLAIRNNNVTKIPNYDPSHSEHLRKILRNNLIRKGASLSKMNISYNELIAADRRGRWWVVGSAWVGQGPTGTETESRQHQEVDGTDMQFSAELLEMARKQRMNTDIRRNIFCILMTAEDFLEASDRLLRLNLKPQQEREILHVTIDCCLHEKNFNPYYAHIVQKFCHLHRRFQIAAQFAFWDRFKELGGLSPLQLAHLSKVLVQLFCDGALSLSVLKVIQFTEMDRVLVRFLRQILLGLLLHPSESVVQSAFQRIASSKYSLLKEGLTLFIHHFLLKNAEKMDPDSARRLDQRVQLAERVLNLSFN